MTPRAATLISRTLIGLGLVMIAVAVFVSRTTFSRADPYEIVVIPQALEPQVLAAADALRRDPGAPTDPALADAPEVMVHEQDRVAHGERVTTTANSPGAGAVLVVSLLWMGTGSVIVSRQPRNLAGWVFLALGFLIVLEGLSQIMVFAALRADAAFPLASVWVLTRPRNCTRNRSPGRGISHGLPYRSHASGVSDCALLTIRWWKMP